MTRKIHGKPKGFRQPRGTVCILAEDGGIISLATSKLLIRRFKTYVDKLSRKLQATKAKAHSHRKTKREDGK